MPESKTMNETSPHRCPEDITVSQETMKVLCLKTAGIFMTKTLFKHVHLVFAVCARCQAECSKENAVENTDMWQGHRGSQGTGHVSEPTGLADAWVRGMGQIQQEQNVVPPTPFEESDRCDIHQKDFLPR